ncbi:MAG: hypothetical protein HY453_00625 [Parcubacteria group bacterium]|nr:hypothetical protein [Parcubacteria group bacterium]
MKENRTLASLCVVAFAIAILAPSFVFSQSDSENGTRGDDCGNSQSEYESVSEQVNAVSCEKIRLMIAQKQETVHRLTDISAKIQIQKESYQKDYRDDVNAYVSFLKKKFASSWLFEAPKENLSDYGHIGYQKYGLDFWVRLDEKNVSESFLFLQDFGKYVDFLKKNIDESAQNYEKFMRLQKDVEVAARRLEIDIRKLEEQLQDCEKKKVNLITKLEILKKGSGLCIPTEQILEKSGETLHRALASVLYRESIMNMLTQTLEKELSGLDVARRTFENDSGYLVSANHETRLSCAEGDLMQKQNAVLERYGELVTLRKDFFSGYRNQYGVWERMNESGGEGNVSREEFFRGVTDLGMLSDRYASLQTQVTQSFSGVSEEKFQCLRGISEAGKNLKRWKEDMVVRSEAPKNAVSLPYQGETIPEQVKGILASVASKAIVSECQCPFTLIFSGMNILGGEKLGVNMWNFGLAPVSVHGTEIFPASINGQVGQALTGGLLENFDRMNVPDAQKTILASVFGDAMVSLVKRSATSAWIRSNLENKIGASGNMSMDTLTLLRGNIEALQRKLQTDGVVMGIAQGFVTQGDDAPQCDQPGQDRFIAYLFDAKARHLMLVLSSQNCNDIVHLSFLIDSVGTIDPSLTRGVVIHPDGAIADLEGI